MILPDMYQSLIFLAALPSAPAYDIFVVTKQPAQATQRDQATALYVIVLNAGAVSSRPPERSGH